jgi:protein-S-isoprenylcysteine O-methyltransferase Ste14
MPHQFHFVAGFLVLLGASIVLWAKKANKFYSETVRIQYERHHAVITEGPYRYVRHPGYMGYMILSISVPLMLGSLPALFPSIFIVMGYLGRTILEDVTLQRQFKGYYDYTKKVPYRLFPGIW